MVGKTPWDRLQSQPFPPSQNQIVSASIQFAIAFIPSSRFPIIMKVTLSIVFLLLSAVQASGALRQQRQQLPAAARRNNMQQDDPRFAITFIDTKADVTVCPNVIVSTFRHADMIDIEGNGSAPYGSVQVRYFNVVDQSCYDAPGDNGKLCRCSTSDKVVTTTSAVIRSALTTSLSVTGRPNDRPG
jgi:hypothetical protein